MASFDYHQWLNKLKNKLKDEPETDAKRFKQAMQHDSFWQAAWHLTEDELRLLKLSFERDVEQFWQHYQQQLDDSSWWAEFKETIWYELALITDRSQLEWQELMQDFKHQGRYFAGEWVGFGILRCESCGHGTRVYHPCQIIPCVNCDHVTFKRELLNP